MKTEVLLHHRILLVEDEENILDVLKLNLELEKYEVIAVKNGASALKKAGEQRFNLIILDVMLPDMDGFAICEQIRIFNHDIPVLFLTAKDTQQDLLRGFKTGADDYMTKPFDLQELLSRVKVLVRHSLRLNNRQSQGNEVQFGNNKINFYTYEVQGVNGVKMMLTKREAQLLKLLIDHKNEVVSRKQILETVWHYDIYPSTRTIDNFILHFRKLFEKDTRNPKHFISIRGIGYKFQE
jgi:two-component system, OmpR family, alkaline phosphatase synthesis response regulator PhoP